MDLFCDRNIVFIICLLFGAYPQTQFQDQTRKWLYGTTNVAVTLFPVLT